MRGWVVVPLLTLLTAACGSVGNNPKDGGGGGGRAGAGGAGGTDGSAGSGGASSDSGVPDASADAHDGGVLPISCQQIKQQNPAAASGVFTIAPLGAAEESVFCEMSVDNGGWTAFYVGDNGSTPGGVHFENAANACPDPANACLRRVPVTIDETHDFAVKCGAAVVKFKIPPTDGGVPPVLDYFKNGLSHQWQSVSNAVAIDLALVGKANLVADFWTGDGATNFGWIAAGDRNATTTTFANGYTPNAGWNYCNGAGDATSRVMLLYR